MNSEKKADATWPPRRPCPSCKQPVEAVMKRHKTMGVFVPVWTAGPCHNPQCARYEPELVPISSLNGAAWKKPADHQSK